jgi:hypothetical protein
MSQNGGQFTANLTFTNAATNDLLVPIAVLEYNNGAISTSTMVSIDLPPTGFTIANYKSLALNNVGHSYAADGLSRTLVWTETGYSDSDYGFLVMQDTSGNNLASPFVGFTQSVFIQSLDNKYVTFTFDRSVPAGSYRFAILDDNNNVVAQSAYFNFLSATADFGENQDQSVKINLTSDGISGTKKVAAGTIQTLNWDSDGGSCITSSDNKDDYSWDTTGTVPPQGKHVTPPLASGQVTYYISCQGVNSANSGSASLTFDVQ